MKYMLLFCGTTEAQEEWENAPQEVIAQAMERTGQWFGQNASRIVASEQLQPPRTAEAIRHENGGTTVTDGPFIEAKEVIGGYAVFDVADEEAALELARSWPGGGIVEVRPVVAR
ncbi:MAG TPA: YciI family protein [Candidatus Dormibacteraeota bacterium]|jgi:hypothetical protein|nr:YciI family protein [Candidatus Dormibacteraeota bacterium]